MAVQAVALAALVAVVGMPHGGLDHLLGRVLLRPAVGGWWAAVFGAGYLAVMAVVFSGWCLLPLVTVCGFVTLSAVHFGMTEAEPGTPGGLARAVMQGGMVVWVPALFQPAEFTRLLVAVVPDGRWPEDLLFTTAVRAGLGLLLATVVVWAAVASPRVGLRVIVFAALFAVTPPLVSFIVYFCGYHSVTELVRLARQAHPASVTAGLARVVRAAAPLAAVAVLLIAIVWWAGVADRPATPWLLQTVFVGLSVVAVPHMLLHWVAAGRAVNPFSEAGR